MALVKNIILVLALIFSHCVFATPEWTIVPEKSTLTFKGTQNNAPASGEFKKFYGTIHFDPEHVENGDVNITVEIGSLKTSYKDMTDTLASSDWFNVKIFPKAIFKASQFRKLSNNSYEALGTLTIRDKSVPVTINFTQEENMGNTVRVKGETALKRTDFGIGQGDWSDLNTVKNDVKVEFELSAVKK